MKYALLIAAVVLISACTSKMASTTSSSQPQNADQANVDRMQSKYPGYTLAEFTKGKAIYEQSCQSCHGLKKPALYTEAQWNRIVPDMVIKTNRKAGRTEIDPQAQETLLKYLITASTSPQPSGN